MINKSQTRALFVLTTSKNTKTFKQSTLIQNSLRGALTYKPLATPIAMPLHSLDQRSVDLQ